MNHEDAEARRAKIQKLTEELEDADPDRRTNATILLGCMPAPEAAERLRGHLDDPDANVRTEVVKALGLIGDRESLPRFIQLLGHTDPSLRAASAFAIGLTGDLALAEHVVPLLNDLCFDVQLSAAEALGRLGAAEHLLPALEHRTGMVRVCALSWLMQDWERVDKALMTEGLDGGVSVDPRIVISETRVAEAANMLGRDPGEIRQRYEEINQRLGGKLRLQWQLPD